MSACIPVRPLICPLTRDGLPACPSARSPAQPPTHPFACPLARPPIHPPARPIDRATARPPASSAAHQLARPHARRTPARPPAITRPQLALTRLLMNNSQQFYGDRLMAIFFFPSVSPSFRLSVFPSVRLSVCPSFRQSVFPSVRSPSPSI